MIFTSREIVIHQRLQVGVLGHVVETGLGIDLVYTTCNLGFAPKRYSPVKLLAVAPAVLRAAAMALDLPPLIKS